MEDAANCMYALTIVYSAQSIDLLVPEFVPAIFAQSAREFLGMVWVQHVIGLCGVDLTMEQAA